MTTTDYDRLCSKHGFPRIDGDNDSADRELHLITLAREHGDAFKLLFNAHYLSAWGVPFFKDVKPRYVLDECLPPPAELAASLNRFYAGLSDSPDHPFFKFPVATTANEQHTNNDTMNLTLNITADPKILDAINNLTAAISSKQCGSAPVTIVGTVDSPAPAEETPEPAAEAPKKRKKAETPAPKVVEPEPEPEVEAPTGAELAERISVLKGTPYTKQLRAYLDEQLGLAGVKLNEVTDAAARNKINEKITQLLKDAEIEAAKAAADDL